MEKRNHLLLAAVVAIPVITFTIITFLKLKRKQSIKKSISPNMGYHKSTSFFEVQEDNVETLPVTTWTALGLEQPLVIAMVGLPARGKSYIVKMIIRYLKWTGFDCKVFNVGSHRRKIGLASADSNFFDAGNKDATRVREEMAMAVQDDMYIWLHAGKEIKRRVAIFDATNTTKSRRLALAVRAKKEHVFLLFVESICDDEKVLQRNYRLKLQNDDYKTMEPAAALKDFMQRVHAYEKVYETIEDEENNGDISYIKLVNVGQKVITRNCTGYLPSQVAFYLQNVHIQPRKIYLSLMSENLEHLEDMDFRLAGAESGKLTEAGAEYAVNLAKFIRYEQDFSENNGSSDDSTHRVTEKEVLVLTGTSKIHMETISHLRSDHSCYQTPILNELRGGDFHGLSKQEIQRLYPTEYSKRQQDKLNYRYPGVGGESYLDVIERIRPVIIELERQRRSILIVCHLAVLRCIYAYFMGVKLQDIPFKDFQLHHVYELCPGPFGCQCSIIDPSNQEEDINKAVAIIRENHLDSDKSIASNLP